MNKRVRLTRQWNVGHDNNGSVLLVLLDVAVPLTRDEIDRLKAALDQAVIAAAEPPRIIIPGGTRAV